MFIQQSKNLLPRGLAAGVALKTLDFKHQLPRFGGLRKLTNIRIFLGTFLVLYFAGYQPVLAFPPIRKSLAQAEFSQQQTVDANRLSQPFSLPHPGYLTTKFSAWHPGIDLATGLGTPIRPISSGVIVDTTLGFWGLGHSVTIQHEQGFKSTYGHMGRIFVKVGDQVKATSIIGEVGLTGHTSGPHTHLEIAKDDKYIDPETVLPKISDWPVAAGPAPQGQGREKSTPQQNPADKLDLTVYKTVKLPPLLKSPLAQS
ncbi:M23 family metallopeptidase [Candidatus Daviesbacteria bacterium]|nr:M23 family metallopeptidase [Candidatus Daviesbacteria bacterium]